MNAQVDAGSRLVMKFGGTSVADIERIRAVARRVKRETDQGRQVAVVVSAMSGATNQLVSWCTELAALHDAREYDAVVASGEQVTGGLLAIALQAIGVDARSWQGWQIPVKTDDAHGKARILDIDTTELDRRMKAGQVAVVAGFQGVGSDNRVTTLGRGGSDTSAVALAAALGADRCDISPMSMASTRRIPGSWPRRASWRRSPTRKCWRWPRKGPRCCRSGRSKWR
jgi:aspartate kinase